MLNLYITLKKERKISEILEKTAISKIKKKTKTKYNLKEKSQIGSSQR